MSTSLCNHIEVTRHSVTTRCTKRLNLWTFRALSKSLLFVWFNLTMFPLLQYINLSLLAFHIASRDFWKFRRSKRSNCASSAAHRSQGYRVTPTIFHIKGCNPYNTLYVQLRNCARNIAFLTMKKYNINSTLYAVFVHSDKKKHAISNESKFQWK